MANVTIDTQDPVKEYGLFSCRSPWDCLHSIVLVLIAAASVYLFIQAYSIISKDQSKRLDRIDYILFILAFIQVALVFLTKTLFNSTLWMFTINAISLIQNIFVCSICSCYCYEEDYYPIIERVTNVAVTAAGIIWFFSWLNVQSVDDINICQRANNLLLSTLNLGISLLGLWFTYHAVRFIESWNQEVYRVSEGTEIEMKFVNLARIKNQILVLTLSMFASTAFQFVWDFHKLSAGKDSEGCAQIYHPGSFVSFLLLLIHDITCKLVPSWAIYYIYYWRDRKSFEPVSNERELLLRN